MPVPAAIEPIDSFTVFSDPALYAAHPQIVATGSNRLVVSFNAAPRRKGVLHPPHDPTFRTYLVTSDDGGCSWSEAFDPFPEAPSGVECAGLTRLSDDTLALNRFTFDWRQSDIEDDDFDPPEILRAELANSVELAGIAEAADAITRSRGPGRATLSFSCDAGRTWSPEIDLNGERFGAGCGLRGGLAGADGMQLHLSDPPRYARIFRLFVDRSGVEVRPPELVAERLGRAFEEPAVVLLDDGVALLVLRENEERSLWSCRSSDSGATWSEPVPLGIGSSHPAALLALGPREVILATGRRHAPAAVLFFRSCDAGMTWEELDTSGLLPPDGPDHGYPALALREDGTIILITYRRNAEGVTGLHGTTLEVRNRAA